MELLHGNDRDMEDNCSQGRKAELRSLDDSALEMPDWPITYWAVPNNLHSCYSRDPKPEPGRRLPPLHPQILIL